MLRFQMRIRTPITAAYRRTRHQPMNRQLCFHHKRTRARICRLVCSDLRRISLSLSCSMFRTAIKAFAPASLLKRPNDAFPAMICLHLLRG